MGNNDRGLTIKINLPSLKSHWPAFSHGWQLCNKISIVEMVLFHKKSHKSDQTQQQDGCRGEVQVREIVAYPVLHRYFFAEEVMLRRWRKSSCCGSSRSGEISPKITQIGPTQEARLLQGVCWWGQLWQTWCCSCSFHERGHAMAAAEIVMVQKYCVMTFLLNRIWYGIPSMVSTSYRPLHHLSFLLILLVNMSTSLKNKSR